MKIAFLCAALAPGRDGVGDYTRRLAAACARLGHDCRLFALNDRHVDHPVAEAADGAGPAIRWPAHLSWSERIASVHAELARFGPDRLSWQWVGYGFHPKGIVGPGLIELAGTLCFYRSHVMLHEIWIGLARGDSAWARFTGWRQRRALRAFLRALRPAHLQTSNPAYAAALARHGWTASVLPLFSNIPVVPAAPEARAAALARHLPAAPGGDGRLLAVTFGTLHPQWRPEAAARWLRAAAARLQKRPALLALGRTGAHGREVLRRLAAAGLPAADTGELDPVEVSCLLQAADLGIAAHPWALAGKSGAVAAMLDHGLPVLVPRDDWRLRDGPAPAAPADPRLARLADLDASAAAAWLGRRRPPGDSASAAVSLFLHRLAA